MRRCTILWLVILLTCVNGCVSIEDKWRKARTTDSIRAYQIFLNKNTDSGFENQARSRIMELKWEHAKAADTLESYQAFLEMYPDGHLADQARKGVMRINWFQVKNRNTLDAYKAFFQKYPEGEFSKAARQNIIKIDWESARQADNSLAYEQFIKTHPVSIYSFEAYQKLSEICAEKDWEKAMNINSIPAYRSFLIQHPHSKFAFNAYKKLEQVTDSELMKFRKIVKKKIKTDRLDAKDVIPVFAIFMTDEPSYFVVKKSTGRFYKSYDHNVMPYHQAARLPLIPFAKPFEGIVLFVNQIDMKTPKQAGFKIARLLFPAYNLHRLKKLRQPNEEYSIIWPFGKSARYVQEVVINTIESQKYQLLPEVRKYSVIENFEKDIHIAQESGLDQDDNLLAKQLLLYLKIDRHQTPTVRIDTDIDFFSKDKSADCTDYNHVDDIHYFIKETVFNCINFYRTENSNPDLNISVKLKADAILASYGRKYKLYTGAKASGTIKVEIPGANGDTGTFKGDWHPSSSINPKHHSPLKDPDPCWAPFDTALRESDFKEILETSLKHIIGARLIKKD